MLLTKRILIVENRESTRSALNDQAKENFENIVLSCGDASTSLINHSQFSCVILGKSDSDQSQIADNCRNQGIPYIELVDKGNVPAAIASVQQGSAGVIESPDEISAAIHKAIESAPEKTSEETPNEDWEDFIKIVRHDLKAPLRTINGFANLLKKTIADSLSEDEIEYLDFIINSANDGYQLLDKLRELQEIGGSQKNKGPVDLNSVFEYVIHSLQKPITKTEANIRVESLPTVNGSEGDFVLLFKNLLSNSLTFATHAPEITISAVEKGGHWEISVSDNGIGFEQEYAKKVFEPCFRLNATNLYEGSGLGLTICQRIANLHDGIIEATSTPNVGSVFTVSLKSE